MFFRVPAQVCVKGLIDFVEQFRRAFVHVFGYPA